MKKRKILGAIFLFIISLQISSDVQADEKPSLFSITTINRYAKSTTDFDEGADIRNFTSEALLSQSRLSRSLTNEELKGIIRLKSQFESFNNMRLRLDVAFIIDLSYKYRDIANGQITNFSNPNIFNDVKVSEYGLALQTSSNTSEYGYLLRGSYKRVNQKGVIEYLPTSSDDIDQYEVNTLVSKFFGIDTASLYATYVVQKNLLNIPNPYDKNGNIFALLVTYGNPKSEKKSEYQKPISAIENLFDRRFDVRGLKLFGGIVSNKQTYGSIDVKKDDYFIGTSVNGWRDIHDKDSQLYDISIESDIFTSDVQDDPSQRNSQYRTGITVYRNIGKTLSVMIPLKYSGAINGSNDFENWTAGAELRKDFADSASYVSLCYEYERFFNLDKGLGVFGVNVGLVF